MWRVTGVAVATALGGISIAACSSGSSSTPATRTHQLPSTTSSSNPAGSAASSSTSGTTGGPSSTAGGLARCTSADLRGSIAGSGGAAGTIEITVALTNGSVGPCTLGGYPGLQLLAAGGADLPTTTVRKGHYPFTAMPPATVTLTAGQVAYFNLGYSDVPVGNETSCPSAASLEVTPPNAFDHLVVAATMAPCGHGTMVVSPVFTATGDNGRTTAPAA